MACWCWRASYFGLLLTKGCPLASSFPADRAPLLFQLQTNCEGIALWCSSFGPPGKRKLEQELRFTNPTVSQSVSQSVSSVVQKQELGVKLGVKLGGETWGETCRINTPYSSISSVVHFPHLTHLLGQYTAGRPDQLTLQFSCSYSAFGAAFRPAHGRAAGSNSVAWH